MQFRVDKEKAVEALVYIAGRSPGVGPFHISKILYFAERFHLRRYGRPIVGDRYIAMENGPVPSFCYDVLKGSLAAEDQALASDALSRTGSMSQPKYSAAREPRLDFFSATDLECLDEAIAHCRGRSFGQISDETHQHEAWEKAALNGPMDHELMMDGVDPELIEEAKSFAAYGLL